MGCLPVEDHPKFADEFYEIKRKIRGVAQSG